MSNTTLSVQEKAKQIRLLILDVDGVMTDGRIILDNNGNELKSFNVRDGHGIKLIQRTGISVAIITGRYSKVVERRAEELGIEDVFQRVLDKEAVYIQLLEKHGISDSEAAFMGDDIIDLKILKRVGLAMAPVDAVEEIRSAVHWISSCRGGYGAVRDGIELIMKSQGKWLPEGAPN
ncbi:MAG: HAD-IIIA family hydrolase [Nitrospirota bacterium]|nr:HAD-IIIA family hydrolase [Nitrospirota bacterium]